MRVQNSEAENLNQYPQEYKGVQKTNSETRELWFRSSILSADENVAPLRRVKFEHRLLWQTMRGKNQYPADKRLASRL